MTTNSNPTPAAGPATAATAPGSTTAAAPETGATTTPTLLPQASGPLAKAGDDLAKLYQDFTTNKTTTPYSSYMLISGTNVKVDIQGSGDFNAFQTALAGLGFQLNNADPQRQIVEGLLPINQILAAASLSQTVGMHPVYLPRYA